MIKKFNSFINEEVKGVPDAAKFYASKIADIIGYVANNYNLEVVNDGEFNDGRNKFLIDAIAPITVDTKDIVKITKDIHPDMPIDYNSLGIDISFILVKSKDDFDYYIESGHDINAGYNPGFTIKDNKINGLTLHFEPFIYYGITKSDIEKLVKGSVIHELTHAYEAYKRLVSTGSYEFSKKDSAINMVANFIRKNTGDKKIQDLVHTLYTSLYFELNANVAGLFGQLHKMNITKDNIIDQIKKTSSWGVYDKLANFSADDMWEDIEREIIIPNINLKIGSEKVEGEENKKKYYNYIFDFIDNLLKDLASRDDLIKDFKRSDVPLFKPGIDPKEQLKIIEKQSHIKAREFRKKLLKVAHYYLTELDATRADMEKQLNKI